MDYFLYNGEIARGDDLRFLEFVAKEQKSEHVTLLLVTPGGSPDAAYKMGRYLQERYKHITVLIPGLCKSAGTLLAIAADCLAFTSYGELGPLDVQMVKTDHLAQLDSGLNISEAFLTLESRARDQFHSLGIVGIQDFHFGGDVIHTLDGTLCLDRCPMGEDGAALLG